MRGTTQSVVYNRRCMRGTTQCGVQQTVYERDNTKCGVRRGVTKGISILCVNIYLHGKCKCVLI